MRPSIMTAPAPRAELLRQHVSAFTRLLHKVEEGDVRAIHRTRVASRRLRELLPVLQVVPESRARLLRDLRRVTRRLGGVRELDVTLLLLERLRTEMGGATGGVGLVCDTVRVARRAAHGKATRKGRLGTDLRRLARRLEGLVPELERRGARENRRWRWALDARVARRAEALKQAIKDAGPFYLPERLHDVRIALKKLRYALELHAEASGAGPRAELGMLRRSQDLLGVLHDRQLLIERLRETLARLPASERRVSRELDAVVAWLEDECRTLHARYVRQRARLIDACDRLLPSVPSAVRSHARAAVPRTGGRSTVAAG